MKKQFIIIAITILLITIGLCGCNTTTDTKTDNTLDNTIISNLEREKFIGEWNVTRPSGFGARTTYAIYKFDNDETFLKDGIGTGKWKVKNNNRLEIHLYYNETTLIIDYEFSKDNNSLYLDYVDSPLAELLYRI